MGEIATTAASRKGFTLVELVVVVMILGILAGIAAPRLIGTGSDAEMASLMTEVKVLFDAIELFTANNGSPPLDTYPGVCPPELEPYLDGTAFTRNRPLGGYWDYNVDPSGTRVNLEIYRPTVSTTMLSEIDNRWDDGNADTGWIQLDVGGDIFFHLSR